MSGRFHPIRLPPACLSLSRLFLTARIQKRVHARESGKLAPSPTTFALPVGAPAAHVRRQVHRGAAPTVAKTCEPRAHAATSGGARTPPWMLQAVAPLRTAAVWWQRPGNAARRRSVPRVEPQAGCDGMPSHHGGACPTGHGALVEPQSRGCRGTGSGPVDATDGPRPAPGLAAVPKAGLDVTNAQ